MEMKELPSIEPYPEVVIGEFGTIVLAHGHVLGRITGFDTTPVPPIPWWRQWWWRVRGLWPIYRCRHDR